MTKPRLVFAYRYGAPGGPTTQLLARLETFAPHFDMHILFERDFGGVSMFPPQAVTVVPTFQEQVAAIASLRPDWFVVFDSGFREAWIRAGSPGKLVVEVRTTTANLNFVGELRAAQRIDLIVPTSHYLAGVLRERGLEDIAPIAVVPNMIRPSWLVPVEPWRAPAPMLLWIGRLEPHKGVRRFIDICDSLEPAGVLPVMIGGVNDTEEEVMDTTARLYGVARTHVPLWFTHVPHDRMRRIYASVAASGGALAITSKNENFPNTVAEATVTGCPVVAPSIGGIPELLPAEALYPAGDAEAACALIDRLLHVPGAGASAVEQARRIVEPIVDPERALSLFLAALEMAL